MWLMIHNGNGREGDHAGRCVVSIHGEIDMETAPRLRDQLTELAHRVSPYLIADLGNVTFCDSSGLSALLGTARRAALLDGELVLAAPTAQLAKILAITGIDQILRIHPTVQAALDRQAD